MTNLTEQLKKGELPYNHHYYFKLPKSKEYEVGNTFCLETLHWCKDGDKIEVIEEVPSYEKWIITKNLSERAHLETYKARGEKVRLEKENTKLKSLLKEWLLFEKEENLHDFTIASERMEELAKQSKELLGEE